MREESVVVTGIGLATPLGCGREATWEKVKDSFSLASLSGPSGFSQEHSSLIRMSPFAHLNGLPRIFYLALSTAREALADSNSPVRDLSPERIGCSVSVSKPVVYEHPFSVGSPEKVGDFLARELNLLGPRQNVIAACATGVHSLLTAARWLQEDRCDIAVSGSVESSLHPLILAGFQKMGVLSPDPRPFDKRRNGFMIGEGAGVMVLERKKDAVSRGAKIYAEIVGCAIGSDCSHPTRFDLEGSSIASALNRAILSSELSGREMDYINLHGTGTRLNDLTETLAVKKVFGKDSYTLAASSTKSSTGHLLGAAASVEIGITCLALRDQFVPPTVRLEQRDPECDLDYTERRGKSKTIRNAVSLSFGFGGTIGAMVLGKV